MDLNSANEGFQREIERANMLFRELQKEFITGLEEKRQHNEALLRGAGIEEKELRKAHKMAETASSKKLAVLLPKLKKTHITSNLELSGRQDKILAIFKGEKLSPELNSPKSRRFFSPMASMQASNADLMAVNSHKFLPASGIGTFLTAGTPAKSR